MKKLSRIPKGSLIKQMEEENQEELTVTDTSGNQGGVGDDGCLIVCSASAGCRRVVWRRTTEAVPGASRKEQQGMSAVSQEKKTARDGDERGIGSPAAGECKTSTACRGTGEETWKRAEDDEVGFCWRTPVTQYTTPHSTASSMLAILASSLINTLDLPFPTKFRPSKKLAIIVGYITQTVSLYLTLTALQLGPMPPPSFTSNSISVIVFATTYT